jgi:hypothetical protein
MQYNKYGYFISTMVVNVEAKNKAEQLMSMDIRMGASVGFYLAFALLAASMSTPE